MKQYKTTKGYRKRRIQEPRIQEYETVTEIIKTNNGSKTIKVTKAVSRSLHAEA